MWTSDLVCQSMLGLWFINQPGVSKMMVVLPIVLSNLCTRLSGHNLGDVSSLMIIQGPIYIVDQNPSG